MSAHALLSASGAKRWMSCTPSARFETLFDETTSDFAEEGTAAHALAEAMLIKDGGCKASIKRAKESKYHSAEMDDYILSYCDFVKEEFAAIKAKDKAAVLFTERRFDYSAFVRGGFGTGDVTIIGGGTLHIIDLKYGKGVPVSAFENPQLMLYGVGALLEFDAAYEIETVKMTIAQPRLDSVSTFEMDAEELYAWARDIVKPLAYLAYEGLGEFKAGEHCRFCKGNKVCKARASFNDELGKYDFLDANKLAPGEIADILSRIDELKNWAETIKSYALEQAEKHGIKWPGWKLVEGRSNRKYTDADQIAKNLIKAGFEEARIYEKSLLGLTAMEKELGKKKVAELIGDLIVKVPGKPTLVPENDNRPAIGSCDSAKADFGGDTN